MHGIVRLNPLLMVIFTLVLMTGCATSPFNPDTAADLAKVQTIAVVPPELHVELIKFSADNERMTEKEAENLPVILSHANAAITENGYELIDFNDDPATHNDSDITYLISKFKEDVTTATSEPKVWNPVGDSARELAELAGSDALLYINYLGQRKSSGEVAKDIGTSILVGVLTMGAAIPVSTQNTGVVSAYLVDGISGEILWRNSAMGGEDPAIVRTALKKFPVNESKPDVDQTQAAN